MSQQTTKGIFHVVDKEGTIICMTTDEHKANYISNALNVYGNLRSIHTEDYIKKHYETDLTVVEQTPESENRQS